MKIINKVYETGDYNSFNFIDANREVKVNIKLEASIKKDGVLVPLIVNEKMQVIDGQHRLSIAEKHNKKVTFIIMQGLGEQEMIRINNTNKAWSAVDYIDSYASAGNHEYRKLKNLVDCYKISPSVLASIAMNFASVGGDTSRALREGRFEFFNYSNTKDFLGSYKKLVNLMNVRPKSTLVMAVHHIWKLENFDFGRLYNNSGLLAKQLNGIGDYMATLEVVLGVYNHRLSSGSKSGLDYKKGMRNEIVLLGETKDLFKKG